MTATHTEQLLRRVDAQLRADPSEFVGRAFVREHVREFASVRNRILVLAGTPGVGKTALAAALVRESLGAGRQALAHFCELPDGDSPPSFCESLVSQLAAALGDGFALPATLRRGAVTINNSVQVGDVSDGASVTGVTIRLGDIHPREAFRQLVREPLRAYDERHGAERGDAPLVLVVDALDRAWQWDNGQGGNIVSLLEDAQDLPPWVNIICTARPGPAVRALRAHAGVRVFSIEPQSDENLADVADFFQTAFLGRLAADGRARFRALLAGALVVAGASDDERERSFVAQAVRASGGNFQYVRHYVDAWRATLEPAGEQPPADPVALLSFGGNTLADALASTYEATYAGLPIDRTAGSPDPDALAALAVAFAPLTLGLLASLSGHPPEALAPALERLSPVIERRGEGDAAAYALYHGGFADYVRRRHLLRGGRGWDVRAAQALEQHGAGDAALDAYGASYRLAHLLRGLDLADAARDGQATGASKASDIAAMQAAVPDDVNQARLLRGLASRALDPSDRQPGDPEPVGSWSLALSALRDAERALRATRTVENLRRRGWRPDAAGSAPDELVELERTLTALGDAYAAIARRMDGGGQRPSAPRGLLGLVALAWDLVARLPLMIFLLAVLLVQGVREIHIPGIVQNLGRQQDWTVARLCVLSVSAYRRARAIAEARGADDSADDLTERLGALYALMGAYDAAAATYEALLTRPTTIERTWRQATWRLALGEVLVRRQQPDRAVEVLTSALPVFVSQASPVQRARALSALAAAHRIQAEAASRKGDEALSLRLDNLAIKECGDALAAWRDVTTLRGDETASVDRELAISRIAHELWRAGKSPRLGSEQKRAARELLNGVAERHYPQRFEHPLLRLFRVAVALLLPVYVLGALLLAIQQPNTGTVRTSTSIAFRPPLLDLNRFPNSLIGGRATPSAPADLSQLVATQDNPAQSVVDGASVTLLVTAPTLDPWRIVDVVLLAVSVYLAIYSAAGLVIIGLSSPAHFQSRRPGRLVLTAATLGWHGPSGQDSLGDAVQWVTRSGATLFGLLWRRLRQALSGEQPAPPGGPAEPGRTLALANVASTIEVNRRCWGYLLYDLSYTKILPRRDARDPQPARPFYIYGSLMHYEDLCEELDRRLAAPHHSFSSELITSPLGICFVATLLYALLLVTLLPLLPAGLHIALFGADYALASLYVLATPGLLLPLIWWFIARPLGISHASNAVLPLAGAALAGALLSGGVLAGLVDLASYGLKPDLATPLLALGVLATLAYYAPLRPLLALRAQWPARLLRLGLALLALAGIALVGRHTAETLLWYHALVRANTEVDQALTSEACVSDAPECGLLRDAVASYSEAIALRPLDGDAYALRGFASLAANSYDDARSDFEWALRLRRAAALAPSLHALLPAVAILEADRTREAELLANLGAVSALEARYVADESAAEQHYAAALQSYAEAVAQASGIDLLPAGLNAGAARPDCYALVERLLAPQQGAPAALLGRGDWALDPRAAPYALQIADACQSRSLRRLERAGADAALRDGAWRDAAGAAAAYEATIAASDNEQDASLAREGAASAWLALSQFDPVPGAPDRRSALLRAQRLFAELQAAQPNAPQTFAGAAWSAIQLRAWDDAARPLAAAAALAPDDPDFPVLQGLVAWQQSTDFQPAQKNAPSPGYTSALRAAIGFYGQAVAQGGPDASQLYATRSLLRFGLRNSPYAGENGDESADRPYADADYGAWMALAIDDMDSALRAADAAGLAAPDQVGYRYWRGRLRFALALTWQEKSRGVHPWGEIAPLYGQALVDFQAGLAADGVEQRRALYADTWAPWAHAQLINASHMHLARLAYDRGDYARARDELALVNPLPPAVRLDERSARHSPPLADFSLLHGLVGLALGDAPNSQHPLVALGNRDPRASYERALLELSNPANIDDPAVRRQLLSAAIDDLNALIESPPRGWPERARANAQAIRNLLIQRLDSSP